MMNVFWAPLGVCANDVVFSQDSKSLCEFGDPSEFVAYGEARCVQLGIEDDAEAAGFLFQAFQGGVRLWFDSLPEEVQSSWFLLKHALLEEFGHGQVMDSMQLLCKVWWQVPNFEQCFDVLWKVYEQVSFFHGSFIHALKERMLRKYMKASMQIQGLYENDMVDDVFQCCFHEDSMNMGSGFEDTMTIYKNDKSSSSSSVHDESEAMDDLSSDEATSFFDEESLYASSTDESDEVASIVDEESMHDVLDNNEASFEGKLGKCFDLVTDVMEPMHEEGSIDNTRGVGKQEDLMHEDFRHEDVVEGMDHGVDDMHVEDTHKEILDLEASKEDDMWDIASLDEQEPMMEMDARMAECVEKATSRIEGALKSKEARSLKAYEPMHVMKLVEEEVNVESYIHVNALERKETIDVFVLMGESKHEEVDLEALMQGLVMVMLFGVAMQYSMQGFCDLDKAYYMEGYAPLFDSFVYGKACKPRIWDRCKSGLSFDLGGWSTHMLMADWETCIWPFDPGGYFHVLAADHE